MRDLKNKLTSSKNTKNIQNRRGKSFGYQVLGFGAGGGAVGSIEAVDVLLVAGGGGSGGSRGGGGGAGGFRTFSCQTFEESITVTIGGGGAAGNNGDNSIIANPSLPAPLQSAGGGFGRGLAGAGNPGGSGGGGGAGGGLFGGPYSAGSGNQPPVSPPQGNPGGTGNTFPTPQFLGGGGGGASASGTPNAGAGGAGSPVTSIFGAAPQPFYGPTNGVYAGGGGGSGCGGSAGSGGPGGGGAGATGPSGTPGTAGTVNTGGGAGGTGSDNSGAAGGSGIVLIKIPSTNPGSYSISPGSNTLTPVPGCAQVAKFTVSGTLTLS